MKHLTSDPPVEVEHVVAHRHRHDRRSAGIYDTLHLAAKPYALEAATLTKLIRTRVPHARSLLDVACGTGEHLRHLSTEFDVQGVDGSQAMLDIASLKLADVALHGGDMRSFHLDGSFDAITCLFSSIGYLQSTEALAEAVANMAGHLADGGVLIVEPWHHHDVWPLDHRFSEVIVTESGFVERVLGVSVTDDVSVLRMAYTVSDDGHTSTFHEEHRLRLFAVEDYLDAMGLAGLVVEHDPVGLSGRGLFIAGYGTVSRTWQRS